MYFLLFTGSMSTDRYIDMQTLRVKSSPVVFITGNPQLDTNHVINISTQRLPYEIGIHIIYIKTHTFGVVFCIDVRTLLNHMYIH